MVIRFLWQWVRSNDEKKRLWAGSGAERSRRRGRWFQVEALEPRQLLTLTLTAAGQAAGFGLSTFATGFPTSGSLGPFGVVFPASGGVLVDDALGNVRLFPSDTDGQNAATVPPVSGASYAASSTLRGMARVGASLYMTKASLNQIVQINDDGTLKKVIATVPHPVGVAVNPLNGHLFVSDVSGSNSEIYDVDPVTGTASVLEDVAADGLSFDPSSGILYAAVVTASGGRVQGFNIATKAMVFDSGTIAGGPDGIALGNGPVAGRLFVNTNGGTVVEVNLATSVQTIIASGGSRGDFVAVDANNATLLVTQSDRIMRLTPGVFVIPPHLLTTTTTLDVTPQNPISGQTVGLTAIVVTSATGIPTGTVTFKIDGQAQAPVSLTEVGSLDQATFPTSTLMSGTHTITAAYSGDTTFAASGSNTVSVTVSPPPTPTPTPTPTPILTRTRTVLTAQPRPANFGRPVTLTAMVKTLRHRGPTPNGSVTFLDGTVTLGTASLRRGVASIRTSSLHLGANTIQADYTPSQGFVPSSKSIVEIVRAQRSRSKAAAFSEIGRRAAFSTSIAIRARGVAAILLRPQPSATAEPLPQDQSGG